MKNGITILKHVSIVILGTSLLSLGACSTWDKLDRTERGAVIGTGTGAVLGGAVGGGTGAILGGVGGGVAGGVIGHETKKKNN